MAIYRVLKPVEHDKVLYLPEGGKAYSRISGADGSVVPVDTTGFIDIDPGLAANIGLALKPLDVEIAESEAALKKAQEDADKAKAALAMRQSELKRVANEKQKRLGAPLVETAAAAGASAREK